MARRANLWHRVGACASGNVDIAYTVFGNGPFDLVVAMGFVTHLDLEWQFPWFEQIRTLGQACRLIVFDKRGTGLSDRSLGYGSLEERADDIRAVMDAAGSERAVIYAISEAGPMALLFAASCPDRFRALVLYGTAARPSQAPGYPIGHEQIRGRAHSCSLGELAFDELTPFERPKILRLWRAAT